MSDFEGSTSLEGFPEVEDNSTEESQESENINNSEDESNKEESQDNQEETQGENKDESEESPKTTDRGTKLDPNPQSAIHQELANAKSEMKKYQEFLQNPKAVKKYLEDYNF